MNSLQSVLLLALAAAAAPAAQPSSLYPSTHPLYLNTPPYQATPGGAYAPTPPPQQPTPGSTYPFTPGPQGTPLVGAAPLPAAQADAGLQTAPVAQMAQVQPSAASLQAPAQAQAYSQAPAQAYSQASSGAAPVGAPQAVAQFGSSQPASASGSPNQAVPARLASDPWRKTQQVLNDIGAREKDGSLAPEKAMELRAELEGLRGGNGLRRPSDGAHLSASARRLLLSQIKAENAEIRRDSAQARP